MLQSLTSVDGMQRVNDFVIKFANVNGSGSASANTLFGKSILRMGVPAAPRNIFPSNIQGLPTWYEVRVSEAGYLGARGGVELRPLAAGLYLSPGIEPYVERLENLGCPRMAEILRSLKCRPGSLEVFQLH